jgi:hypothetical protein
MPNCKTKQNREMLMDRAYGQAGATLEFLH